MKYVTLGVCSKEINFDVVENKIKNVSFIGGCDGNLLGISSLIEGMDINEVISRLKGIQCGSKYTSCPDQLARALEIYKTKN
ncbi:TIGR03905 family TSCPD domain-containing protein [Clostridium sp. UBA5119]|uniref:TIGR03905 family TSCPD domain-containing protein n=1 Tax=Clostridium sp. UBA5119 TaxID=1946366 RepID=UPI003217DD4F